MEEVALNQQYDNYFAEYCKESPRWIEPTAWLFQPEITTPVILSSMDTFSNYGFPETDFNVFGAHSYETTTNHDEYSPDNQVSLPCGSILAEADKTPSQKAPMTPKTPKTPKNGETTVSSNNKPVRKRKSTTIRESSNEEPKLSTRPKRHHQFPKPKVEAATPTESENSPAAVNNSDTHLDRNRIASNKFRARKRSEITQLESEEYVIEDMNRQLRAMLDSLTSEVLNLKMQLLQHTTCDCKLIQVYINKEAQQYVQGLDATAHT